MLVPMQLQFNIALNSDDELLHTVHNVAVGRVVVNRFLLWVPKLTPRDSLYHKFVTSFLKKDPVDIRGNCMRFRPLVDQVDLSKYLLASIMSNISSFTLKIVTEITMVMGMLKIIRTQ